MYPGVVEDVAALGYLEEARALLEGLLAHPGMLRSWSLPVIVPFASRYFTIFLAVPELMPETYLSREALAVLRLTPTLFTTEPTTSSRVSERRFWLTSCW